VTLTEFTGILLMLKNDDFRSGIAVRLYLCYSECALDIVFRHWTCFVDVIA
jgi:hypothetical protein